MDVWCDCNDPDVDWCRQPFAYVDRCVFRRLFLFIFFSCSRVICNLKIEQLFTVVWCKSKWQPLQQRMIHTNNNNKYQIDRITIKKFEEIFVDRLFLLHVTMTKCCPPCACALYHVHFTVVYIEQKSGTKLSESVRLVNAFGHQFILGCFRSSNRYLLCSIDCFYCVCRMRSFFFFVGFRFCAHMCFANI